MVVDNRHEVGQTAFFFEDINLVLGGDGGQLVEGFVGRKRNVPEVVVLAGRAVGKLALGPVLVQRPRTPGCRSAGRGCQSPNTTVRTPMLFNCGPEPTTLPSSKSAYSSAERCGSFTRNDICSSVDMINLLYRR